MRDLDSLIVSLSSAVADWLAGTTETGWHRERSSVNLWWKTLADCFLLLKHYSWVEVENWRQAPIKSWAIEGECYFKSVLWPALDVMECLKWTPSVACIWIQGVRITIISVTQSACRVKQPEFQVSFEDVFGHGAWRKGFKASSQSQRAEYQETSENMAVYNCLEFSLVFSTQPFNVVQERLQHKK